MFKILIWLLAVNKQSSCLAPTWHSAYAFTRIFSEHYTESFVIVCAISKMRKLSLEFLSNGSKYRTGKSKTEFCPVSVWLKTQAFTGASQSKRTNTERKRQWELFSSHEEQITMWTANVWFSPHLNRTMASSLRYRNSAQRNTSSSQRSGWGLQCGWKTQFLLTRNVASRKQLLCKGSWLRVPGWDLSYLM